MSDRIKVGIKVRPLIAREISEGLSSQWKVKDNTIFQLEGGKEKGDSYVFDYVFDDNTTNDVVFNNMARPIVESAVHGFNGTLFAYGQTSSGKTFTMMGNRNEPGIIPLTIQYLFQVVSSISGREFLLRASYIEIYNEKLNDLLQRNKAALKLREGPDGSVTIVNLKEELVHTPAKIMDLMRRGEKTRRIGETNMNERSSRSHTIFRIIIESRMPNDGEDGVVQVSHLNLVDLAGSERVDQTGARGERLKEGCAINRSLFMLSHVISQLSEGQDQYVNFRDSKLTRILQSSLGGNALTAIICAVTPAAIEETASTIGFALRAINVKVKPHVNEVLSDAALLRRYNRQIARLQDELQKAKTGNGNEEVKEIKNKLQEQVRQNELLQERLQHSELLQERISLLRAMVLGSTKTDSDAEKRRALRRRTWCGNSSKQPAFTSCLEAINEEAIGNDLSEEWHQSVFPSSSMKDLANNDLFETPLEEFELQLIDDQNRFSADRPESPDSLTNITYRNSRSRHVTFEDPIEQVESVFSKPIDASVQTEPWPPNTLLERTIGCNAAVSTPPPVLRERIKLIQQDYDELREFTTLEKQIFDEVSYKQVEELEKENKSLNRTILDQERMILDLNCKTSELTSENKVLRDELELKTKEVNELAKKLLPLSDVEKTLSAKLVDVTELQKQLKAAEKRIQDLENEKSDFEWTLKLAENKLQSRITELTQSLEEAWNDLGNRSSTNVETEETKDQSNMKRLEEQIVLLNSQLKEKDNILDSLKHQINELNLEKDMQASQQKVTSSGTETIIYGKETHSHSGTLGVELEMQAEPELLESKQELTLLEKGVSTEKTLDCHLEIDENSHHDVKVSLESYLQLKQNYYNVKQELTKRSEEIQTLKLQIEEFVSKNENTKWSAHEGIERRINETEELNKEMCKLKQNIELLECEKGVNEETIVELKNSYEKLQSESVLKDEKLFELSKCLMDIELENLDDLKRTFKTLKYELNEKEKDIATLNFELDEMTYGRESVPNENGLNEKYRSDYSVLNEKLEECNRQVNEYKLQIEHLESEKDINCKRIKELEENDKLLKEENKLFDLKLRENYNSVQNILKGLIIHLYADDIQHKFLEDKSTYDEQICHFEVLESLLQLQMNKINLLHEENFELNSLIKKESIHHKEMLKALTDMAEENSNLLKMLNDFIIELSHELKSHDVAGLTLSEEVNNSVQFALQELNQIKSINLKLNEHLNDLSMLRDAGGHFHINNYFDKLKMEEIKEGSMSEQGFESTFKCPLLEEVDKIEKITSADKCTRILPVYQDISSIAKDMKMDQNYHDELNLMSSKLFPGHFGAELIQMLEIELENLHQKYEEFSHISQKIKTELQRLEMTEEQNDMKNDCETSIIGLTQKSTNLSEGLMEIYEMVCIKIRKYEELKQNYREIAAQLEENTKQLKAATHENSNLEIEKNEGNSEELIRLSDQLNSNLTSELETTKEKLFNKTREIESCRRTMVKEIQSLNSGCDVELLRDSQLSELLKNLLALIMEKEAELISHLQLESEHLRREMNESSRAYADKDRKRDAWVRELETEIESMQKEFSKAENNKMKESLKALQEEKDILLKKLKQSENDSTLVKTLKEERDDLAEKIQSYEKNLTDIKTLEDERNELLKKIKQFESDMARVKILEAEKDDLAMKLNDSLVALKKQREDLFKRLQQSEHMSSYIKNLEEERDIHIKKSENNLILINALQDERDELKKKLQQSEMNLNQIQLNMHNLFSRNETITEELNSRKLLLEHKDVELSHLHEQLHHFQGLEDNLSFQNEKLQKSNNEIVTLEENISDLEFKNSHVTHSLKNREEEFTQKDIVLCDVRKNLEYQIEQSNKMKGELGAQIETLNEEITDLKTKNSKLVQSVTDKEEEITQKNIVMSELHSKLEDLIKKSNTTERELEMEIETLKGDMKFINSQLENKEKALIQKDKALCDLQKKLEDQSSKTKKELEIQIETLNEEITDLKTKNSKLVQSVTDKEEEITQKNIVMSELHSKLEDLIKKSNTTERELEMEIDTLKGDMKFINSQLENKEKALIQKDKALCDLQKKLEDQSSKTKKELEIQIETLNEEITDLKTKNSKLVQSVTDKEEEITQKNIVISELHSKLEDLIKKSNTTERELEMEIDTLKGDMKSINSQLENKEQIEQFNETKTQTENFEENLADLKSRNSNMLQLVESKDEIGRKNVSLSELHKKLVDQLHQSNKTKPELEISEGDVSESLDSKDKIVHHMEVDFEKSKCNKNKNNELTNNSEMEESIFFENENKIFMLQEQINPLEKDCEFIELLESKVTEVEGLNKKLELKNMELLEVKNQLKRIVSDLKEASNKNANLLRNNEELLRNNNLLEVTIKQGENEIKKIKNQMNAVIAEREALRLHFKTLQNENEKLKDEAKANKNSISKMDILILKEQQLGADKKLLESKLADTVDELVKMKNSHQKLLEEVERLKQERNELNSNSEALKESLAKHFSQQGRLLEENGNCNSFDVIQTYVRNLMNENTELGKSKCSSLELLSKLEKERDELREKNRQLVEEEKSTLSRMQFLFKDCAKLKEQEMKMVPKCSVATATEITGCQCSELAKQLQQSKGTIVELNAKISSLQQQITTEDFPFQKKVSEMESNVNYYKNKNNQLKMELKSLYRKMRDTKKMSVKSDVQIMKSCSVQTCNEDKSFRAYTDSQGNVNSMDVIVLEQVQHLKSELREKEELIQTLKSQCQERQTTIATLEKKLLTLSQRRDGNEDGRSLKELEELEELKLQLLQALEKNKNLDYEKEEMLKKIIQQEREIEQANDYRERLLSELQTSQEKLRDFKKDSEKRQSSQMKELTAKVEDLADKNRQLMKESEGANHCIQNLHKEYAKQKAEQTSVPPNCSVATLTDVSGCQCLELTEKLRQSKLAIVKCNSEIGSLKLQIESAEFPFQKKLKEKEENLTFYRKKNSELKTELRYLEHRLHEATRMCESCARRNSLTLKSVSVQANLDDEVVDYGGSGIVREGILFDLRIRVQEQAKTIETLKNICRDRRKKIEALENQPCTNCTVEKRIPRPSIHAETQTDSMYLQADEIMRLRCRIHNQEKQLQILKIHCKNKSDTIKELEEKLYKSMEGRIPQDHSHSSPADTELQDVKLQLQQALEEKHNLDAENEDMLKKIEEQREEIREIDDINERLRLEIQVTKRHLSDLKKHNEKLQAQLSSQVKVNERLILEIQVTKTNLSDLKKHNEKLQAQLRSQVKELSAENEEELQDVKLQLQQALEEKHNLDAENEDMLKKIEEQREEIRGIDDINERLRLEIQVTKTNLSDLKKHNEKLQAQLRSQVKELPAEKEEELQDVKLQLQQALEEKHNLDAENEDMLKKIEEQREEIRGIDDINERLILEIQVTKTNLSDLKKHNEKLQAQLRSQVKELSAENEDLKDRNRQLLNESEGASHYIQDLCRKYATLKAEKTQVAVMPSTSTASNISGCESSKSEIKRRSPHPK